MKVPDRKEEKNKEAGREIKSEVSFEIGEMIEVYDDRYRKWRVGLIRYLTCEKWNAVRTIDYTFYVSKEEERMRSLSNEKLKEKLFDMYLGQSIQSTHISLVILLHYLFLFCEEACSPTITKSNCKYSRNDHIQPPSIFLAILNNSFYFRGVA